MKLKANLNLTKNIDVYLTPLSLVSVERFFNPLFKTVSINANYLLTTLESKSQSYTSSLASKQTASQQIENLVKYTQVSLSAPQIRFCSFQVGLAEDKKNMLIDTLTQPDELVTESLFILCMHKIETQLVDDSNQKTAAIFKIEQIDTQFRRLHTLDQFVQNPIKLSCIRNDRSKASFQCFNQDENVPISFSSGSIMFESALEGISIKAIKEVKAGSKPVNMQTDINSISSDQTITNDEQDESVKLGRSIFQFCKLTSENRHRKTVAYGSRLFETEA
jgi:hypothetical protein